MVEVRFGIKAATSPLVEEVAVVEVEEVKQVLARGLVLEEVGVPSASSTVSCLLRLRLAVEEGAFFDLRCVPGSN
mgnify:CR=1 FL=1